MGPGSACADIWHLDAAGSVSCPPLYGFLSEALCSALADIRHAYARATAAEWQASADAAFAGTAAVGRGDA
jgi:hypothetical protein